MRKAPSPAWVLVSPLFFTQVIQTISLAQFSVVSLSHILITLNYLLRNLFGQYSDGADILNFCIPVEFRVFRLRAESSRRDNFFPKKIPKLFELHRNEMNY
jgi:hypothetical protein